MELPSSMYNNIKKAIAEELVYALGSYNETTPPSRRIASDEIEAVDTALMKGEDVSIPMRALMQAVSQSDVPENHAFTTDIRLAYARALKYLEN